MHVWQLIEELTRELDDLRHRHGDYGRGDSDRSVRRQELEQQLVVLKEVKVIYLLVLTGQVYMMMSLCSDRRLQWQVCEVTGVCVCRRMLTCVNRMKISKIS